MFNGQMLFDRPMHVKVVRRFESFWWDLNECRNVNMVHFIVFWQDDKSLPPDDYRPMEKTTQLPRECAAGVEVICMEGLERHFSVSGNEMFSMVARHFPSKLDTALSAPCTHFTFLYSFLHFHPSILIYKQDTTTFPCKFHECDRGSALRCSIIVWIIHWHTHT